MSLLSRVALLGALVSICLSSGCAFVDQKVPLEYNAAVADVEGGQGQSVVVAMPICPEMETTKKGLCIVGNVKNSYGMKTADTTTEDSVPQWITEALCVELEAAGFTPQTVEEMTSATERGVSTRVIKVWVEQDPGFWTVGAIGEIQLRMALHKNGQIVKEFDVESKGQGDRNVVGGSKTKEESLRIALEACMKEALPIIVDTFKE